MWHDSFSSYRSKAAGSLVGWVMTCLFMWHSRHTAQKWWVAWKGASWLVHVYDMTHRHVTWLVRVRSHGSKRWRVGNFEVSVTAHGGDQTWKFWISRSTRFSGRSFEWRGLRLLTWKPVWTGGDSRENVFDMYGESREKLWDWLS